MNTMNGDDIIHLGEAVLVALLITAVIVWLAKPQRKMNTTSNVTVPWWSPTLFIVFGAYAGIKGVFFVAALAVPASLLLLARDKWGKR